MNQPISHQEELDFVHANPGFLAQVLSHAPGKWGEYLVVEKLLERGIGAGWADPFKRQADLVAQLPSGSVTIEVKAAKSKSAGNWPIKNEPRLDGSAFWVLVSGVFSAEPVFWVLTAAEANEAWRTTVEGQRARGRVEGDIFKTVLVAAGIEPEGWQRITGGARLV